ncbi:MAG: YajQ family cyclic di-GMP-binding protein [Chloroflexi bacterium]|jgi:uncharacterized protein YajQ (UPF0234 family)|nr:YajQ family cyclic di-GMP-binding protein [Chloroflexota bacterium]MCH2305117.1 YajQ family cyclic di-GMP-binding protein [SAR202 cluster bacterium]|tara:strand:- start:23 stop:508 length:486 start_codon:yes stop_codon:yes gene_type:complete
MPSFDIVSKTDLNEVDNSINMVNRTIQTRFDFKGSNSSIERSDENITLLANDEMQIKQLIQLFEENLSKRKIDKRALEYQTIENASGGTIRQIANIKQGIEQIIAKNISKNIKSAKLKVQISIQGDELRVTGKKRDDLQTVIELVKKMDVKVPLQYINFRE